MAIKDELGRRMMRNFYRCFILPQHIERAEPGSERHESLSAEYKRRWHEILGNEGCEEAFKVYVARQQNKQAIWDAYRELQEEDATPEEIELAHQEVLESRHAFSAEYDPVYKG